MALARAQRDADYQKTVELVNRFTISTVQFLNRFAALCEEKLHMANRSLQNMEIQVKLLEVKLDSTEDSDGESPLPKASASPKPALAAPAPALAITNGAAASRQAPPPPPGFKAPGKAAPPLMPGFANAGAAAPPPPGSAGKQPPLPPGIVPSAMAAPAAAGGPLMLMPPPPPGQPPAGYTPPPPPPMPLGTAPSNLTRNHPRLAGYFKMLDAGVPNTAVKLKMQVDGLNPAWLDAPDAPAPSGIPPLKSDTLYDSD